MEQVNWRLLTYPPRAPLAPNLCAHDWQFSRCFSFFLSTQNNQGRIIPRCAHRHGSIGSRLFSSPSQYLLFRASWSSLNLSLVCKLPFITLAPPFSLEYPGVSSFSLSNLLAYSAYLDSSNLIIHICFSISLFLPPTSRHIVPFYSSSCIPLVDHPLSLDKLI